MSPENIRENEKKFAPKPAANAVSLSKRPVLTYFADRVFRGGEIEQGAVFSLDFDNQVSEPPDDMGMTYSCVFDRTVDGLGSGGTACASLPGEASFGGSTGVLSWTPDDRAFGPFELFVTGSNQSGSGSRRIVVAVRPAYKRTGLRGDFDAQFGDLAGLPANPSGTWRDLTNNAFDATLVGTLTAGGWNGAGTASNPFRLLFSNPADRVDFGASVVPSAQTSLLFTSWLSPSASSATDKVILGNGGGTGRGFVLKQSKHFAGKLELHVGPRDYASEVLADAPVGYWRLNETSGTAAADSSGNGRNGTYYNGVLLGGPGALARETSTSATFDGVNDRVAVSHHSSLSLTQYTVEAWVNPGGAALSTSDVILAKDNSYNYLLYFGGGGNVPRIYSHGTTLDAATSIPSGIWSHIVATYDGATRKIYVNGVLSASNAQTGTPAQGTGVFEIGTSNNGGAYHFPGAIDEVAVYNYALSAARVQDHYVYGHYNHAVLSNKPVGYWRLGESSGTVANDSTPNLWNGTYTGNPVKGLAGALLGESNTAAGFGYKDASGWITIPRVEYGPPTFPGVTLEAWIKTRNPDATANVFGFPEMTIIGDDDAGVGFSFGVHGGTLRASVYGSGGWQYVSGAGSVIDGMWHHVAMSLNHASGTIRLYVDGSLDGSGTIVPASGFAPSRIGAGYGDSYRFLGTIDEAAVYPSVLAPETIAAHYRAGKPFCLSTTTLSDGAWYNVSGLHDGTNAKLFVNGRQECSVAATGLTTPATSLAAGATAVGANAWAGSIADARFYSSGTAADVAANFKSTVNRFRQVAAPSESVVAANLVLDLDAAYGAGADFPGTGCGTLKWFDRTGSSNDGALTNFVGCGLTSGWNGTGTGADPYRLSFDGVDDQVQIPSTSGIPNGASPRTLEVWMRPRNTNPGGALLSIGGGVQQTQHFILQQTNAGADYIFTDGFNGGNNITATAVELPTVNQWNHIAMTLDGADNWKYYLNGAQLQNGTFATRILTGGMGVNIGQRTDGVGNPPFPGDIARAAIYAADLTSAQVRQNLMALAPRFRNPTPESIVMNGLVLNLDAQYATGFRHPGSVSTCVLKNWFDLSANGFIADARSAGGCGTSSLWQGSGVTADPYRFEAAVGDDDYYSIPDAAAQRPAQISVEIWIRMNSGVPTIWQTAVMKATNASWTNGYGITYRSGTDLRFFVNHFDSNKASANVSADIAAGRWVHIVGTYDGSAIRIYRNGALAASTPYSTPISHSTNHLFIGGGASAAGVGGYYWRGGLAKVAIYNRALSATEVLSNCDALKGRFTGVVCAP